MPFEPPGTDIGYEPPPPELLDAQGLPWFPDPITGPIGIGDSDGGGFGAPGGGGGAGGGLEWLSKLFGGKKDALTQMMALLAGLIGGGALGRGGGLGDSEEMRALLSGQKRRMDLQDPLFSAATRTAFSLLPTASRQGLSIGDFGQPAGEAPMTRLQQRSANVDEDGNPVAPGPLAAAARLRGGWNRPER